MQVATHSHGLITRIKFDEYRASRSAKRISELESHLAKLEANRVEKERLEKAYADLQGQFEAFKGEVEVECGRLYDLVYVAESRLMGAEVMRKTLEIDLKTSYDQWKGSLVVNQQLEVKVAKLAA